MKSLDEKLKEVANIVNKSNFICAFTGAGISTASGISDYRSKGGLWNRFRVITFQEFMASEKSRVEYWERKKELFYEMIQAKPNNAHIALAELEKIGKLKGLITQNIDGLHSLAGNSRELTIELHGTNRLASCLTCCKIWPIEDIQKRLETGEKDRLM